MILPVDAYLMAMRLGSITREQLHNGVNTELKLKRNQKIRESESEIKIMFNVSFDYDGVVHKEILPTLQTGKNI